MEVSRTGRVLDAYETEFAEHVAQLDGYSHQIATTKDSSRRRTLVTNAERVVRQMQCDLSQLGALAPSLTNDESKALFFKRQALIKYTISSAIDRFTKCQSVEDIETRVEWTNDEVCFDNEASPSQALLQKDDHMRNMAEKAIQDANSHAQLANDIDELHEIMTEIGSLVNEQGSTVDSIEHHVEQTQINLHVGERQLKKCVKYKAAQYPLAAAAIGAAFVGGPVGLAAGSIWAAASAAIGGGILGAFGGKMIKNKVTDDNS